ncbi:spermatogenesis associated 6-like protein isoform X2 [Betta splendens]|uniref:Spermatogenesis associated 6-like protein isoform X2 n=1 Tax=Betta splendens TaxID=158456 RepID=A0A6P7KS19_BETSP|nr:spermatogenesis associated 6-like protein isoform X2 [Betta splendens]
MSSKALKVVVEVKFRAVSCPGVRMPARHDVYLSMCFMGQYRHSEDLPAVFPLLFNEKMTFEKIFRHALDPGEITVMLAYETVRIELVELIPPRGHTMACFEEDARSFLFPEPKLVPSFSGVDREVLMTRASHFPGIAPRLEFSTKTTIIECSADEEINIYPNVSMRLKRNEKGSGRPRTSSPQRKQPQTLGRKPRGRKREGNTRSLSHSPRSQSLSPVRAGNTHHPAPGLADWDRPSNSQSMLASWPGTRPSALTCHSALLTSSPLVKPSSSVRFSPSGRRNISITGLSGGVSEGESSSSEPNDPLDHYYKPDPSALWLSYRKQASHSSGS